MTFTSKPLEREISRADERETNEAIGTVSPMLRGKSSPQQRVAQRDREIRNPYKRGKLLNNRQYWNFSVSCFYLIAKMQSNTGKYVSLDTCTSVTSAKYSRASYTLSYPHALSM
jgi:hypothetical protein